MAVLATLSTTRSNDLIERGRSTTSALTDGYQLAILIAVSLVGAAIVVALTVLQRSEAAAEPAEAEPAYLEVV